MITAGTFILLIALELIGLGVAYSLGHAIRSAFLKKPQPNPSPRFRTQNVIFGYGTIFVIIALLVLLKV